MSSTSGGYMIYVDEDFNLQLEDEPTNGFTYYDYTDYPEMEAARARYGVDITAHYYPIFWKLIFINNQYYAPLVARVTTDKVIRYLIALIPLEINILKSH